MSDMIDRGVEAAKFSDYSAGDVYRVKPLDRDSGQKSGERFDEQLEKKKKDRAGGADSGQDNVIIGDQPDAVVDVVQDELLLSSESSSVTSEEESGIADILTDDVPVSGEDRHINLIA